MSMKLSVVSPTKKIAQNVDVVDVTIPTSTGQIQVLENHTELMTTLGPGLMNYRDDKGKNHYLAISFGYAEVQKNNILVMAHTAETEFDLDVDRAKAALKKAEEALSRGVGHDHFKKYELKLYRAQARLQLATMKDN